MKKVILLITIAILVISCKDSSAPQINNSVENKVLKEEKVITDENKNHKNNTIRYSILPLDFDEYYETCIHPYDSIKCDKDYPKYFYTESDAIAEVFQGKFYPTDYMYLPKVKGYQPLLLCNTGSDTESYDLVIMRDNKIISSLEIGIMDGESIMKFNISKDYQINISKQKNIEEKATLLKTYIINDDGIIVEKEEEM